MTEAELQTIIQAAGGGCWALDYAGALLKKITRLEAVLGYATLFKQLRSAKDSGDFRGRILEVNFAYLFVRNGLTLQYGAKQGMSGDVDFCWCVLGRKVFIEMKLLGQDEKTKKSEKAQLEARNFCATLISDDRRDIGRIQRDIFQKSTSTKFKPTPDSNWINLVAVDVSELQLGTIDFGDCLLAVGGNQYAAQHSSPYFQRASVVGVFEPADKQLTAEEADWVKCYHYASATGSAHPRDYIHGVLFLFRSPKERAALSYELNSVVVWNPTLIDKAGAKSILVALHQIVPPLKSC